MCTKVGCAVNLRFSNCDKFSVVRVFKPRFQVTQFTNRMDLTESKPLQKTWRECIITIFVTDSREHFDKWRIWRTLPIQRPQQKLLEGWRLAKSLIFRAFDVFFLPLSFIYNKSRYNKILHLYNTIFYQNYTKHHTYD